MLELHEGDVVAPTGTRVHYRRVGEGDPVVLLHGIAHSSGAWDRLILPLGEQHDVIAIDLPGCGRSDKPRTDYSLGNQATAVRHVLDALGLGPVSMIGHSLGGGVAMTFAYQYPERTGRLGLLASGGLGRELHLLFRSATLPVVPEQVMRVLFDRRVRAARMAAFRLVDRTFGSPFFVHPERHPDEVAEIMDGLEDAGARHAFLSMLRSASNITGQAISALDRIRVATMPMLILWGRQDAVFPVAHAERAAALVPHARLVILDECGHFPQVEATAATVAALRDWLDTTAPAPILQTPATFTPPTPISAARRAATHAGA